MGACMYVCAYARARARARVSVCAHVCACVCVCVGAYLLHSQNVKVFSNLRSMSKRWWSIRTIQA